MIVIWPSVYVHPEGIHDPRMRATNQQDSEWILLTKSENVSQVRLRSHLSEETRLKLTDSRAIEIASLRRGDKPRAYRCGCLFGV